MVLKVSGTFLRARRSPRPQIAEWEPGILLDLPYLGPER